MKRVDIKNNVSKAAYKFLEKNFEFAKQEDGGWVLTEVSLPHIPFIFIFPNGDIKVYNRDKSMVFDFNSLRDAVDFIMV
ncbi:MAG: hypothetical protein LBF04_00695 [Prevotellaceae bacterium]|jgi:hypothetical protein|nr:hypothetical protein [Prevotellaceae bacterium]